MSAGALKEDPDLIDHNIPVQLWIVAESVKAHDLLAKLSSKVLDRRAKVIVRFLTAGVEKILSELGYWPVESAESRFQFAPFLKAEETLAILSCPVFHFHVARFVHDLARKYEVMLDIQPFEKQLYYGKARRLALCYCGFSRAGSMGEANGAAIAAFLACAYDVCTDWRFCDPARWYSCFERIADELCPSAELRDMALELYRKDIEGRLERDGLERGSVAFLHAISLMGVTDAYSDPVYLGEWLQIADDILDLDQDDAEGEINCLLTPRKRQHIQRFLSEYPDPASLHRLFPFGEVLKLVLRRAREESAQML